MNENKPIIIQLSFKNNMQDIYLYEWICKHNGKSNFIKDILKQAMESELTKST